MCLADFSRELLSGFLSENLLNVSIKNCLFFGRLFSPQKVQRLSLDHVLGMNNSRLDGLI